VLAYKLDSVGFSEDGGNATNTGDSPLEGAPGEFDNDGDGIISQGELGEAAFAFATGQVSQAELSEVAFAFATRADTPSQTSYTTSELEWTTNTSGTASVEIGPESLTSTVYKCERATSSTQLGVTDSVVVNFDYELVADQWWEVPVLEVYVDGERVYRGTGSERFTGETIFQTNSYGSAAGSIDTTIQTGGDTVLLVGIEPSDSCSAADHADTTLEVSNLNVTAQQG
jgi:hypothetical protein